MRLVGYGVIFGAVWLYVYQPLAMAVAGGLLAGLAVGYGLRGISGHAEPVAAVREAPGNDPDLARLLAMGFRAEEVSGPLAAAHAAGMADPVGYVMGRLIR